jgi:hypothetical protein
MHRVIYLLPLTNQRSNPAVLKHKEEKMKTNVGMADKIFRIIVGIALIIISLVVAMSTALKIILLVVGIILIITALTGFCGLYTILGVNTCKKK